MKISNPDHETVGHAFLLACVHRSWRDTQTTNSPLETVQPQSHGTWSELSHKLTAVGIGIEGHQQYLKLYGSMNQFSCNWRTTDDMMCQCWVTRTHSQGKYAACFRALFFK